MGWLNSFLGSGKSAAELEQEAFPAVTGTDKQSFSFVYTHQHWVAGRKVAHHITGELAVGVQLESPGIQKWSILMNNLQYDWTFDCLPETYLLFSCVKRIELYVDEQGKLLDTLYPINQSVYLKEKKRDIKRYITDEKQLKKLNRFFESNLSNTRFLQQVLPQNPVIRTLITALLAAGLHNSQPELGQIAEPYHIPGYFGNAAILPIKACWLHEPAKNSDADITWLRIGGADEQLYKEQNLVAWLSTLNDNFNIGKKLDVDFAEQYRFKPGQKLNVAHLVYAESYLQTIIAEGWYKEEEVIIQANNRKEEIYGQG
jgi:hypothetical protein